jgi:signal peptidase II
MRRAWYSDPLLLAVLVSVFAADQVTKTLVVGGLQLGESWPVDGFLRLTHARNTGTAFGLFQNHAMVLTIVSFVAVAVIIFFYRNAITSPLLRAALGLQLGGAFGNLLDRVRLGYVVDFVDVGPWPIFNVADSSIVVGIAILAWHFWFRREQVGGGTQTTGPEGTGEALASNGPGPVPSHGASVDPPPPRPSPSGDPQA